MSEQRTELVKVADQTDLPVDVWDEIVNEKVLRRVMPPTEDLQHYFMAASGQLRKPQQENINLYLKLIEEEAEELLAAIDMLQAYRKNHEEEPNDDKEWRLLKEVLDGIIDVEVVSNGLLVAMEIRKLAAYQAVHINNMTKIVAVKTPEGLDYCVVKDVVTGKVLKPEGYKKVDLDPFRPQYLLEQQPPGY